ncbi:MAG: phosphate ABC transporter permease subunit PstC [Acidobacteria bacterium RIFCSPLOWO2_02_FULL_67_36]|nr:MAG: phosphate ABC transporter permease subunit PstC [Acidobacteria bacterium RIFCSPLOWO2_02_FULL_67_36]OFW23652.1 MAG: phosphate ABC transporter permease subunit PstC [Acidobacteria bacterium RIFCSPLOWO2_12_FULL_66_21]
MPAGGWRARLRNGDEVAHLMALLFGLTLALLTTLVAFELVVNSSLARHRFGWSFLTGQTWDPVADQYGAAPFIYGTVVTSAIALIVAVPLGIGAALFLAELAPRRISDALTLVIELLAAVPSVVYGLIGVAVLVPLMRQYVQPALQRVAGSIPVFTGPAYGVGYLTAGLVLAIMIVPFIVSVVREVLLAVPREQREAALALGSTRWESTARVVLPYARLGVFGAVFLALGRALGETMAVTMVIGNRPEISASLFAPGYSMAAVIANEFTEATGNLYLHALVEIGLVLFLLTMIVNAFARILIVVTTRRGTAA